MPIVFCCLEHVGGNEMVSLPFASVYSSNIGDSVKIL